VLGVHAQRDRRSASQRREREAEIATDITTIAAPTTAILLARLQDADLPPNMLPP
jgi:hypothetical protein